ncbi:hypothetical protein [Aeromonas jandaei]|uniref:hypothetical protein n=3 Tax=Aeromonas jandaei TaxID=650 RepID=UPI002B06270D|nr:hypothetical protein [Aeromonas jandaei]
MIKLENISSINDFWDAQKSQLGVKDYYQDILLPLIKTRSWSELENKPILCDSNGEALILFSDNCWNFSKINAKVFGLSGNIHFTCEIKTGIERKKKRVILEKNICNEIKCFVLIELFFSYRRITVRSLCSPVSKLIKCAIFMLSQGINSFNGLSFEHILKLVNCGLDLSERGSKSIAAFNRLAELDEFLPFKLNFSQKLTCESLNVVPHISSQHPVIPPRIYIGLMQEFTKLIDDVYKHRFEINIAINKMLDYKKSAMKEAIRRLRNDISLIVYIVVEDRDAVLTAFVEAGIPFVDHGENPNWETLWNKLRPTLSYSMISKWTPIHIGSNTFSNVSNLYSFISECDFAAKYLLLALTGMRIDELWRISPVYGLQELKLGSNIIYQITTRQSKITLTSQTSNDIYITSETGKKAYEILNSIHTPYRERFTQDKHRMFASIKSSNWHQAAKKTALGKALNDRINAHPILKVPLSKQDCDYLMVSDPTRHDLAPGNKFKYSCHQLRRSFSYYLIGYELLSFPQLKQQLGHLSINMTRWYAMNASSFQKIFREVTIERTKQQSNVFSRIYNKIANNERIAGGLGLSLTELMKADGTLHFEKTENKRKLSSEYWQNEIQSNRSHIHAIAPGMFCTKRECAMRISIDLSECVDCSWNIIEDVSYVETIRMNAMRNLLFLYESGELNKSSASKYVMQIRSAEKIMSDIGFEYERFKIPPEAETLLIHVQEDL